MVAGFIRESELDPDWRTLLGQLGERAVKKVDAWFALRTPRRRAAGAHREPNGGAGPGHARAELGGQDVDSHLARPRGAGKDPARPLHAGRRASSSGATAGCSRASIATRFNRLRAEIEPVSAADFMRFLLHWQHVAGEDQVKGAEGLAAVVEQLEGFEIAAAAWEHDVLPARVRDYGPSSSTGCASRAAWPGDVSTPRQQGAAAQLADRAAAARARARWGSLATDIRFRSAPKPAAVREALINKRGASFFHELVAATGLVPAFVERGLAELAGAGVATADSFAGLRALLAPPDKRRAG